MQIDSEPLGLPGPIASPDGPAALLEQIIRQSPIGMAVIDDRGRFLEVNPAYCRLYGWQRAQMVGQPFTMVVPPAQRAQLLQRHRNFLDRDEPMKGELDVIRADGQPLAVLLESVRLPGADGRARRLVYVVDITERRRIERALQGSREFLGAVLDGLSAHVCVLDEQGAILAVNRAWRAFADANGARDRALHEGANYLRVCESAAHSGRADGTEAATFIARMQELLAGQRQHFELDYPCHAPGLQRWFVVRATRMAGQVPARIVVAHDDVTALKRVQDDLRENEALLRDLAASLPGAMFRLVAAADGDWRFTYFSPGLEALVGLSPERACADPQSLGACLMPEDRPVHDRLIGQAVAARQGWAHDLLWRAADGQVKWVHSRASPKPGDGGATVWTGMLTDVSASKRLEAGLLASQQQYRTLFETVPQGVMYLDAAGRISAANPAAQRILGRSLLELLGLSFVDARWQALREDGSAFPDDQYPSMVALRTGEPVRDVLVGVAVPDRGRAWLLVNATPLERDGVLEQVYTTFEDITERVLLSRELRQQATTDFLTGAANRRSLTDRLQFEFERVQRHPATHCSVMSIDLDHFKQVNDRWGHATGDAVLCHVARLMQQSTRQIDLVARSGGEEFTLLLPDTSAAEALALAERLRERIAAQRVVVEGRPLDQTVSIGIAMIEPADTSADAVLARADTALYEAKNAGRNKVRAAAQTR